MRTTAAGPDGVLLAGKLYDLQKATAQELVAAGCAEIAKVNKKEPVLESANLEPAAETTTEPKSRPIGRKRADTPEPRRG